jgi:hypothetical protein
MWPNAMSACRRTRHGDVTSSGSQMPTATSVRQWTSPGRDISHSQAALAAPGNHRWRHGHGEPSSWSCRAVLRTAPSPGACWPAARGGVRLCTLRRAEPRSGGASRNRTTRFRTPRCACMGSTWNTRIAVRSILQSSICGCALPVRSSGQCLSGVPGLRAGSWRSGATRGAPPPWHKARRPQQCGGAPHPPSRSRPPWRPRR